jgi:hypothetical protein
MDGLKLADKIAYGAGQAARKAGVICDAYRAQDAACPIKDANRIIRMPVVFTPASGTARAPAPFGVPYRQAVLDQAYVHSGDYLVGPAGTFLIASNEPPQPVLSVLCNEIISLWRAGAPQLAGVNPYGAILPATAMALMTGFPAALLPTGLSDRTRQGLPDDTKLSGYTAMLAAVEGVVPDVADILRDGKGRQFILNGAQRFGGAWRLSMIESVT